MVKEKSWSFIRSLIFFYLLLNSSVFATELLFFYEKGCPYSAKVNEFMQKRIRPNYPVEIKLYEIHEPDNARLLIDLATAYRAKDVLEKGVPAVFVGNAALQGSSRVKLREIEEAVRTAIRNRASSPLTRLPGKKFKSQLTLPVVIGAAIASMLNPCAVAVLILLLSTILVVSRRREAVLGAGFAFTAVSLISYFFIGLGLFTVVQGAGIQHYSTIAVSVLAILIGLWYIKDFFWQGSTLPELAKGWQPLIKRSTSRITPVLGASLIGFSASLFLLPCTSGPYIVIIGMLAHIATRTQAIWLLLVYNVIFILPFIIITLVVGLGFSTTTRMESWRQERLRKFRLITGSVMFALGITLVILLLSGTI